MRWSYFLVAGVAFLFFSCNKYNKGITAKNSIVADSIELHITGGFTGESRHYLITGKKVFQDTGLQRDTPATGTWDIELPQDKFDKVKNLRTDIPARLIKDGSKVYGSNKGVYDYPTIWVVARSKGTIYKWTFEYDAPDYVQPFLKEVSESLDYLR